MVLCQGWFFVNIYRNEYGCDSVTVLISLQKRAPMTTHHQTTENTTKLQSTGPLAGLKVVEFTSVVLGPWATQTLGDLGADVIKVEAPRGDSNRNMGEFHHHDDMKALYLTSNRNKRCIVLDIKQPEGLKAALKLCEDADIVVHNQRPQAIEKLGLGYKDICKVNPSVIYCGSYGYSKDGPYGDRSAMDDAIQAASGIAMLMQEVYGEPRYLPTVVADKTTAMAVVQAILAALFHRERSGEGQEIEVPMFETMVHWMMCEHSWGQTFEPAKGHAGYDRIMEKGRKPFKTKDGYLAVLPYLDHHWTVFAELADAPELTTNPDFTDMKSRLKHGAAMNAAVADVLTRKTSEEWLELLKPTSIPHMRVNSLDDLFDDPHLAATGYFEQHSHPTEGTYKLTKGPFNFSKTPTSIRRLPPRFGEHSREILMEHGYNADEIEKLAAQKTFLTPKE